LCTPYFYLDYTAQMLFLESDGECTTPYVDKGVNIKASKA